MNTNKNKGFWTRSLKVVAYLEFRAGIIETSSEIQANDKNLKGLTTFYYEDGDYARELMKNYKDDAEFHKIFDCYFRAKRQTYTGDENNERGKTDGSDE